ncbi:uncharacterized protein [Prorops nasuta]|uniref:uncharacterized protein n=1 Tax=Prorops nasuta TaxID=863751 RepID=UPI0034CFEC31
MSRKRDSSEILDEDTKLLERYVRLKKRIARMENSDEFKDAMVAVPEEPISNIETHNDLDILVDDKENEPVFLTEMDSNLPEPIMPKNLDFDCLDEDILKILGKDPTSSGAIGMDLHPSLEKRWKFWVESGIPKSEKADLLTKYERLVPFEAPKLNREIVTLMREAVLRRDNYFCDQQNAIGSALSSLGGVISLLLRDEGQLDKLALLQRLGDAGKLLTNLHFELAKARKVFIIPGLNKNLRALLGDKKSDAWLFGANFADNVKETNAIEKLSQTMVRKPWFKKPLQGSPRNHLNWRGPSGLRTSNYQMGWRQDKAQDRNQPYTRRTQGRYPNRGNSSQRGRYKPQIVGNEEFIEPLRSIAETEEFRLAIDDLIKKGAIEKCKPQKGQFLSNYFLITKSNGDKRFILNLKRLNKFIKVNHFKMEDIRTALRLISEDCAMGLIDLKDAYFLIPIHKKSRRYLRFKFEGVLYEFVCLPFGLCSAPFIFTKLMKPVVASLRERGFLSVVYLDDILCLGKDEASCKNNIQETIGFLESLGFLINYEKKFRKKEECCIREFAHLIGNLVAASRAVKYAWIHIKTLERLRFLELTRNGGNYDEKMGLSAQVREDLLWWEHKIEKSMNSLRNDNFDCEIFTDASNSGWGAVLKENRIHGFWSEEERSRHINYLELLAIYKALLSFLPLLNSKNVLLRVDNTTAVSYINKAGGIRFKNLSELAREIWCVAEKHNINLFASYIPSKENVHADKLSRIKNWDTEWELAEIYFKRLVELFGQPELDLFASSKNAKCDKFCTWHREKNAVAIDAFTISWGNIYFYAFPPFSMVLRTLMKIIADRAEGIKDDTSIIRETVVNCSEGLRQAFVENTLQEDTIQILLAALSSGTQKQYNSSLRLWKLFCEKVRVNPFKPSIANVLNFFTEEFDKGVSFGILNTHRAAISFISGFKLGENKWINKFMKGVFRLRPSRPRYNFIWDVSKVLDELRGMGPLEDLSLLTLTRKTLMLLALASGHRVQTFAAIKIKNIKINPRDIVITVPEFLKTSGPGRAQPLLLLPFFQEDSNLCAARTLSEYLNRTSQFRENIETLFITIKRPFKGASSQTLSRWLKDTLEICGIDTSIFKAHSTRHAATSAAYSRGVDIESIRRSAGWSENSRAFQTFYNRPIRSSGDTANFVSALLS